MPAKNSLSPPVVTRNSHEFLYSLAWLLRLALGALVPCELVGCSPGVDLQMAAAADTPPARGAAPESLPSANSNRYIGVSTCASVGCHAFTGNAQSSEGKVPDDHVAAWRTAYWTWQADDPHAIAYDVLWRPRAKGAADSRNIVAQLDPQAVKSKSEYSKFILKNCCGCHATGVAAQAADNGVASTDESPKSLALGVHCEACHGPARDWVKDHTLNKWVLSKQTEQEAVGHRTTRDLTIRASLCVACHIGSTDTPGQEVNHDLIAAGHPRLNFEFTVFLSRIPAHWDEQRDRKWAERPSPAQDVAGRPRTNFELEAWHTGQLVSARQALRLLAGRADRAAKDGGPWPEFSEYDCFACHHELNPAGYRQRGKSDGIWSSTNWYTALSEYWFTPTSGSRDSLAQLLGLLEQQTQPPGPLHPLPPEPQEVFQAADSVRKQLDSLLAGRPNLTTPTGRADLARWLASEKKLNLSELGWMETTQWLLAVTACVKSFDVAQVKAQAPDLESLLQALEDWLAFAPVREDKPPDSSGAGGDRIVNSPRIFDPTEPRYRQLIAQIREKLKKLVEAAVPNSPEAER